RVETAGERVALLDGGQLAPGFMRPAVVADLVAAGGDLLDRVGIHLAIDRLDEERGEQAALVELVEQPREGSGDRGVASRRDRLLTALERAGFAQVVEGE